MHLLQPIFANPAICKVFHGADSDILWLQRDFHIYIANLFDTARACDVLGKPQRSLAYLLQTYCGIAVNKVYQVNCYVVVAVLACEHLPSSHVMQFFE
jgi:cation-transporting P-type ATPase D